MKSEAREPTAMLEIDGGLRLRLGVDLLVELSVLRLRIAAAFAAKVCRPCERLHSGSSKYCCHSEAVLTGPSTGPRRSRIRQPLRVETHCVL